MVLTYFLQTQKACIVTEIIVLTIVLVRMQVTKHATDSIWNGASRANENMVTLVVTSLHVEHFWKRTKKHKTVVKNSAFNWLYFELTVNKLVVVFETLPTLLPLWVFVHHHSSAFTVKWIYEGYLPIELVKTHNLWRSYSHSSGATSFSSTFISATSARIKSLS